MPFFNDDVETLDGVSTDDIVEVYRDYVLVQEDDPKDESNHIYKIFDNNSILISKFESVESALDMSTSGYKTSDIANKFHSEVYKHKVSKRYRSDNVNIKDTTAVKAAKKPTPKPVTPKPVVNTEPEVDASRWLKSDTIVFHKADSSTTMLKQIYEGKGWDVVTESWLPKSVVHELLTKHDKILMLGHGSAYGLMGGNIGPEEAPYLKDKNLFVIWCNADAYFNKYLSEKHGFFCTGNMPSDFREAAWVGFHVGEKYMDDNITYWCKLCGDVAERALNGDPNGAVQYIRDKYWEKYGQGYDVNEVSDDSTIKQDIPDEVRITKYNWVRTKVQ